MAELAREDLFVVRNLGLSFQDATLLCDAFNGLTLPLDDGQFPWAKVELRNLPGQPRPEVDS
jgi:hypothetical protein